MKIFPQRTLPAATRASALSSAFTLIELLVVISIIAIIAAILFPVFAQVREKARESTCISNLRQVGIAVREYVSDYDETFPIFQAYNTSDDHSTGFSGAPWAPGHLGVEIEVMPYISSRDIFKCPDDAGDQAGTTNYAIKFGSSYRFDQGSFSVIAGTMGSYQNDGQVLESDYKTTVTSDTIVTDSSFANESNTRLMRDEEFPWFGPTVDPTGAKYNYNVVPDYYKQWHARGGGIVFADGHAKFVVSETVFDNIAGDAEGSTYNSCAAGDNNCGTTIPASAIPRCWTSCD